MSDVKLKRTITLPHLILYGVGSMIGAGIYVLIGIIAGHAQLYTPIAFLIAGIVGLLTALSYAELSTHFPYSAGAALYVYHAFKNNVLSIIVGYSVVLTGIISCSALAKGFAGYAREFINIDTDLLVFFIVMLLGAISCWRIHMSMWIISIISIIEMIGLVFIMTIFASDFEFSKIQKILFTFPSAGAILDILTASLLAFYAFVGFEDMVNVVEELKNTKKIMQRGIVYAFLVTTLIYFLIAIVTVGSINIEVLSKTEAPFAKALLNYTAWGSKLISIISIIATTNGILIQIVMASRVLYGMARKKIGIQFFASVNSGTHTPINAILFCIVLILIFAYFLPIEALAKLTSLIVLSIFCLVNLSLVKLILNRAIPRKRTVYLLFPSLALIATVILLSSQLYLEIIRWK